MTQNRRSREPFFSQIDVSHGGAASSPPPGAGANLELVAVLREILAAQDRQNELLEELLNHLNAAQRQRANELGQWKQANPELARDCRIAAEALSKVQTEYLTNLTQEINENFETLRDGEFMLNEFVDRFGPRVAHLNGLLQVLSQLSASGDPANMPNTH
jgi:chromosome condensin MukBEF ATPase and DNA-binding subunit MukB